MKASPTPATTLLVFALDAEARGRFDSHEPLYTGMGKFNAAYRLMSRLNAWRAQRGKNPEWVLNLGTAGSKHFKSGSIVNCTSFIQRDFDATALGSPLYTTPYDATPALLSNGHRFECHPEGICGTGDNFITSGAMTAWNVVDMEAYVLAKVCWHEKIRFGCLKYITDGADGQAARSWEDSLDDASKGLHEAVKGIFTPPKKSPKR